MPTTNINTGLGQNLTPVISLEGDWDKAVKLIGTGLLSRLVLIGARKGQMAAAEKLKQMIKSNIKRGGAQGTYWPGYSLQYGERKSRKGGGDKKWRWTDTYLKSVAVINRDGKISVGVPAYARGRVNQKNPLTLGQIAVIMERGSRAHNIAARPLWRPTLKQFGGKKRIAYHINYHIRKEIFLATGLRGIKLG